MDGSLTIVGFGIQFAAHATPEARGYIEGADTVLYYAADPASGTWLRTLNVRAHSLLREGDTHEKSLVDDLVDRMLEPAREGQRVCVAVYGHPSIVFAPTCVAIRRARREGITTRLLPGISALDCLFADLEIDPAEHGCQIFEASEFVVHGRRPDPSAALVLFQPASVGHAGGGLCPAGVPILADYLEQFVPADHDIMLYEAAQYPVCESKILRLPLRSLAEHVLSLRTLLYVPPSSPRGAADLRWLVRLARARMTTQMTRDPE